ncbi:trypsin-like peptidase domain-containing protein [Roseibacillus persicicus]|uniref:trypsin-like peptidase domain-containing protein n=1 Tax=Roseibacillus persicicus TaxID=454148 RepID=UPI00398AE96D
MSLPDSEEVEEKSWKEVIRESERCVVSLEVEGEEGKSGTGFFVSRDGLLVTNFHVISGARVVRAKNYQGFTLSCQGIVVVDEERDLAVLKFSARDLPFLDFVETNDLEKGEEVLAIGNPMGLDSSATRGIVSALRKEDGVEVIQFDAAVSPGSSGSPVLNQDGEVLGVATFVLKGRQGYNFAVASRHVKELLELGEALDVVDFAEYDWRAKDPLPTLDWDEDVPLSSHGNRQEDGETEVVPQSPYPHPNRDEARAEIKLEKLNEFWSSYWESFQKPNGASWAVHFMESCDYQYKDDGRASRADIAQGAAELKSRYPTRIYNYLSGPRLVALPEANRIGFDFDYEYFYTNGQKLVGGISKTELALTWDGEKWLIDKFRESIEKYENPASMLGAQDSEEEQPAYFAQPPSREPTDLKEKEAGYMTTMQGTAVVWNNSYRKGDGVQWSGDVDDEWFANGEGTLSWFKNGLYQYSYTGTMVAGKFDGPVTTVDQSGNRGRGYYRNGRKAGRWSYVSKDGGKSWSKQF